jgi:hypothetical protein
MLAASAVLALQPLLCLTIYSFCNVCASAQRSPLRNLTMCTVFLQVLACLVDNKETLKSDACSKEVFYLEKMEVNDFRIDMALAEACRADVGKLCKDVQPGEGRVHKCLRDNNEKLSQACK